MLDFDGTCGFRCIVSGAWHCESMTVRRSVHAHNREHAVVHAQKMYLTKNTHRSDLWCWERGDELFVVEVLFVEVHVSWILQIGHETHASLNFAFALCDTLTCVAL